MKLNEYRMKQALLKDILNHYKHKFDDDFLEMAVTDVGGYIEDNKVLCHIPCRLEIDFISKPFLRSFVSSHDIILQMSAWMASLSYESAVECYCKLCLCD